MVRGSETGFQDDNFGIDTVDSHRSFHAGIERLGRQDTVCQQYVYEDTGAPLVAKTPAGLNPEPFVDVSERPVPTCPVQGS